MTPKTAAGRVKKKQPKAVDPRDESLLGEAVSSIRPLSSDPSRCSILVGRRKVATVQRAEIEAIAISVGDEWTESVAKRVAEAAELSGAKAYALRRLAKRAMTERELHKAIERQGHAPATAERTLEEMRRLGLMDDEAIAKAVTRTALCAKPAGRRFLLSKLRQRGVERQTAARVVEEALDGRDSREDAVSLARSRIRFLPRTADEQTARRRIYAFLARRGIDPSAARDAVDEALRDWSPAEPTN